MSSPLLEHHKIYSSRRPECTWLHTSMLAHYIPGDAKWHEARRGPRSRPTAALTVYPLPQQMVLQQKASDA